jgi:hypothetical protein
VYFLGLKAAGVLPASCAVVRKSGNLNFLELSGPLQACNGTAAYQKDKQTKPDNLPITNVFPQFAKHWTEQHLHLDLKGLTQSCCSQKAMLAVSQTQTLTTNNASISTVPLT